MQGQRHYSILTMKFLRQEKYNQKWWNKFLFSGAGVVEMKFYTTVNVTDVRVHGTATRGEKIDVESYTFEGKLLQCEISWNIPHCNLVIWY